MRQSREPEGGAGLEMNHLGSQVGSGALSELERPMNPPLPFRRQINHSATPTPPAQRPAKPMRRLP
jgi:hypothetical protein